MLGLDSWFRVELLFRSMVNVLVGTDREKGGARAGGSVGTRKEQILTTQGKGHGKFFKTDVCVFQPFLFI